MNRNRRPLPGKARKALEKEIKKGQKELLNPEETSRTDILTPNEALKKYSKRKKNMEKPLMEAVTKEMRVKKKKAVRKSSKRTTPGNVKHRESSPAHVHPEGERWQKTLDKQNKTKRNVLTAKLQKHKRGK